MIGTPSRLEVHISRKLSDGDYGSFEVGASLAVDLPPDANLEEAFNEYDAWLTASVAGSVREKQANIAKQKPQPEEPKPAPVAEIRTPVGDDGLEFKDIAVDYIKVVYSEEGEKRARTFGGLFKQYGVVTYPEALAAIGFDLEAAEAGVYALPAPYKKARVTIKGKNAKGFDIPGKVDHFIK